MEAEHPPLIWRLVETTSNLGGDCAMKLLPLVCLTLTLSMFTPSGGAQCGVRRVKTQDETEAKVSSRKMNFLIASPTDSTWGEGRN